MCAMYAFVLHLKMLEVLMKTIWNALKCSAEVFRVNFQCWGSQKDSDYLWNQWKTKICVFGRLHAQNSSYSDPNSNEIEWKFNFLCPKKSKISRKPRVATIYPIKNSLMKHLVNIKPKYLSSMSEGDYKIQEYFISSPSVL